MKVVLIGAGRLATNMALALQCAHHEIVGIMSLHESSCRQLAERVGCFWTTNMEQLRSDADLYVIAVSDHAVPEVVNALGRIVPHAFVVHTAGSLSMEVYKNSPIKHFGIFYPLQTFSKGRVVDFHLLTCFVEADGASSLNVLKNLAQSLGSRVFELSSSDRRYLHLAAVFACNFSNHCYAIAGEILKHCGVPFDVLLPLIDETAGKVHEMSPHDAQTGPAVRFDENVLSSQKTLLSHDFDYLDIYSLLSSDIQKMKKSCDEYDKL